MKKGLCLILSLMLLFGSFHLGFAETVELPAPETMMEFIEEPAVQLVEEPVEEPTEEPTEEPVEEPMEEPTEEPVEEPMEELTEEPVEEPMEEPTEEPVEEPVEEPTEEPVEEPVEETTEEQPSKEVSDEFADEEKSFMEIIARGASSAIVITSQPENVSAPVGETITFSVEATGAVRYRWYNRPVGTEEWKKTSVTGYNTDTLSVGVTAVRYNYEWCCLLTDADGLTLYTDAVMILEPEVVEPEPEPDEPTPDGFAITGQPVDVEAAVGETITFSVEAAGAESYRWYNRLDGTEEWKKTSLGGYNTAALTVPVTAARYNYEWRCTLTDAEGNTLDTDAVRILKPGSSEPEEPTPDGFAITKQPENVEAEVGKTITFSVEATGAESYRWYNRLDGTEEWKKTSLGGYNTAALTVPVTAARYNYEWRCTLTDSEGNTLDTDAVRILKPGSSEPEEPSPDGFAITKQPENVEAEVGKTITFSVEATGAESYRWYNRAFGTEEWKKTSLGGYNTATLTVPVTAARYNYEWRCTLTDSEGNTLDSAVARIIEPEKFEITRQPENIEAEVGTTITFSVEATGVQSYRWYNRASGTEEWKKTSLAGYNTAALTVPVTATRYNYEWRCTLTDAEGNTLDSNAVRIMQPGSSEPEEPTPDAFAITRQPENIEAEVNATITFSVEATGVKSYRWYNRALGTEEWKKTSLSGYNTASLTVPVTAARYNYEWCCIVTDAEGNTLESIPVRIIVPGSSEPDPEPDPEEPTPVEFAITKQPEDIEAALSTTVTFSVEATGVKSYRWYNRVLGTEEWGRTSLSGYNTATLTVPVTAARYNYEWRCTLTDTEGNTLDTNAVRILEPGTSTPEELAITKQPVDVEAEIGTSITFSVEATGAESYRWYNRLIGTETWNRTSLTGYNTPVLTVTASAARYNYEWRCTVTDANGNTLDSEPARIIEPEKISFTRQPESVTAAVGETITFSVEAIGAASYQWQTSMDGDTWVNAGSTTDTLTVEVKASSYIYLWRCVITSARGTELFSDPVQILMPVVNFEITGQPEDVTLNIGDTVTFSVTAEGAEQYQWQMSTDGADWVNCELSGADTATLSFTADASTFAYQWRCVLTSAAGDTLVTNVVRAIEDKWIVANDVTYEKIANSNLRVYAYNGNAATVIIPETVEGLTVTEIGESAFENNTALTSIDLPDTITIIGAYSFKGCTNLSEMY